MDSRRGADVVTCSCRCAGPGPGPFCTCPDGYQCEELIGDFGVGASEIAGSYCVKPGTEFTGIPGAECDRAISNCE